MSICMFEYGTKRNLVSEIPDGVIEKSYPNCGPAEREELRRADRIDAITRQRQKEERRNFKGYD